MKTVEEIKKEIAERFNVPHNEDAPKTKSELLKAIEAIRDEENKGQISDAMKAYISAKQPNTATKENNEGLSDAMKAYINSKTNK